MYRSTAYTDQTSKSVFLEMSERSAHTARLLQRAQEARPEKALRRQRALVRRAASRWDRLLQRMGNMMTQHLGEAHG